MYSHDSFRDHVIAQVDLLKEGKALDAFDQFCAETASFYANGTLIGSNAQEGRAALAKALKSATDIDGRITDLTIADDTEICVFRDHTSFAGRGKERHQSNGLVWQKWRGGKIIQQQSFDGAQMDRLLDSGILKSPDTLGRRR